MRLILSGARKTATFVTVIVSKNGRDREFLWKRS